MNILSIKRIKREVGVYWRYQSSGMLCHFNW